jgi:hypothetical protein
MAEKALKNKFRSSREDYRERIGGKTGGYDGAVDDDEEVFTDCDEDSVNEEKSVGQNEDASDESSYNEDEQVEATQKTAQETAQEKTSLVTGPGTFPAVNGVQTPGSKAASKFGASAGDNKTFYVTMSCATSLKELDAKRASSAILKSANAELAKHFGTAQAPIRTIEVMSYDNGSPVSLKLTADHLPGDKLNNHITDNGACMLDLHANTKKEFAVPKLVYSCEQSDFQRQLATDFPNVDIATIEVGMKEVSPTHVLVDSNSIIMHGISKQLELAAKAAKANGETFSMAANAATPLPNTDKSLVKKEVAIAAINLIKEWDVKTKDRIDVNRSLHFELTRSKISPQTAATQKSSASPTQWVDTRELKQSLKSGHTIENQILKPFEVTLVCRMQLQ